MATNITTYFTEMSGISIETLKDKISNPYVTDEHWDELLELENDCCVGNEAMKLINTADDLVNMTADYPQVNWINIYNQIIVYLFA